LQYLEITVDAQPNYAYLNLFCYLYSLWWVSYCFCLWFTEAVGYGDPVIAVMPFFHDIKW